MSIQAFLGVVLGVSIFLAVLAEGMMLTGADIRYLFSRPARLVRTILAMSILPPIAVLLAVLVSEVATTPYKMWRKRLLSVGPADAARPPG